MFDSLLATTAKVESCPNLTLTETMKYLAYTVIAFTFVVCPAIAGYCITTLYYIVKDFPSL